MPGLIRFKELELEGLWAVLRGDRNTSPSLHMNSMFILLTQEFAECIDPNKRKQIWGTIQQQETKCNDRHTIQMEK